MRWRLLIGTMLLFALVFVAGLFLHGLLDLPWTNWRALLALALLFAVAGAYYGTIVALDRRSDGPPAQDRPLLRTLLCGLLGTVFVLLIQWWSPAPFDLPWMAAGFVIGGALGWLGWSWAKHVDF